MTGEGLATLTRIMLVDDHPDFRDLMVTLLEGQPDLELVAQAGAMPARRPRRRSSTLWFWTWASPTATAPT